MEFDFCMDATKLETARVRRKAERLGLVPDSLTGAEEPGTHAPSLRSTDGCSESQAARIAALAGEPERVLINAGESARGWHRLQTFLKCPRYYAYSYVRRLALPGGREPLVRGSLIHVGLAHHYAQRGARQVKGRPVPGSSTVRALLTGLPWIGEDGTKERVTDPERFYSWEDAVLLAAARWDTPHERKLAWACLPIALRAVRAHINHWQGRLQDVFTILGVERQVVLEAGTLPSGARAYMTARLDLVVSDGAGGVLIIDHKSSAVPTRKATMARYRMSGQIHGFHAIGGQLWGTAYRGTKINIVGVDKVNSMQRAKPAPAPAMRGGILPLIRHGYEQIEALESADPTGERWPCTTQCKHEFGYCPALEWCAYGVPAGAPRR